MSTEYINNCLTNMSATVINGAIISRLDHIAYIGIDNTIYINVYRRYNSPYEIIIVCSNFEIITQMDCNVSDSILNAFYLTPEQLYLLDEIHIHSMKYNATIFDRSIFSMKWSDLQNQHTYVNVNMYGLLNKLQEQFEKPIEQPIEKSPEDFNQSTPVKLQEDNQRDPPKQSKEYKQSKLENKEKLLKKRKRDTSPIPLNNIEEEQEENNYQSRKHYCLRNKKQRTQ